MKTFIRATTNYLNKNGFVWALLAFLPTLLFNLMRYFGETTGLTTDEISLTQFGSFITWTAIIVSFMMVAFKAIADQYDYKMKQNGTMLMDKVIENSNDARKKKRDNYLDFIQDDRKRSICKFMAPFEQMRIVQYSTQKAVSEIIGINTNDIGVFVLYKLPGNTHYKIINTTTVNSIRNHVVNKVTLIPHEIRNGKMQFIIYPSGDDFSISNWYYQNGVISLYCANISSEIDQDRKIEAYSFVSTCEYPICKNSDRDAKEKFKNIVMPVFDNQFSIELLKFYIKELDRCNN